jgi:hypothetical protein
VTPFPQARSGTPVDPEAARAVHERAARITEEIYGLNGQIDMETINALFSDDDEPAAFREVRASVRYAAVDVAGADWRNGDSCRGGVADRRARRDPSARRSH